MSAEPLLAVEGLRVAFPAAAGLGDLVRLRRRRVHAVNGVDLIIHRGETLGLVGESGCGKSTLSRALVGLAPSSGRIQLDGRDLAGLRGPSRMDYRRRVQMVFQEPHASLNPRQTVGETLAEVLRVHRACPAADVPVRVATLLEAVGLSPAFAGRRPHGLSGGQCQRVGIARALALDPDLIIADEAVSALDVSIQAQILNLFMELQQARGLALLFVSHDLAVVRHLCQQVAVMYLGRLVEVGPTSEVLGRPRHPYTRALVAAIPQGRASATASLAGEPPSPLALPTGCSFHPRCPDATDICARQAPAAGHARGVTAWCHHQDALAEIGPAPTSDRRDPP